MRKIINAKTIIVLMMLMWTISPAIADKLPSQTFKEDVWSGGNEGSSSLKEKEGRGIFVKSKGNEETIIKDNGGFKLFSDEPDPDDGEGGGQGGGGFVGSGPLPLSERECLFTLLFMAGGYGIFHHVRSWIKKYKKAV
jgi:hypothetical protein